MTPPLILTLTLDANATRYFNDLRTKYFPIERNFLKAHLTLFHALPNNQNILSTVNDVSLVQAPFSLNVVKPVSIGKGVAFKIDSPTLLLIHQQLQKKWTEFLLPQDKQKLWPHVTIQNKVAPIEAQQLLATRQTSFRPFTATATGMQLFEYLNGPWKFKKEFFFTRL